MDLGNFVQLEKATLKSTQQPSTKILRSNEEEISAKSLTKPQLKQWNINGTTYKTTSERWDAAAATSGIGDNLVCVRHKINCSHHDVPEEISKCQKDDRIKNMTLPFSLNFQPPRISERNTQQRCAANMTVEKIVNKYNDVNFLFSVTASKTILPFPKLQVTETSRDTWDFNPAGVVDLNTISQYRQLLTDCVKCIVGTFEWASFYQTLHKQSPSFVEGKRMIVFHYTEKNEKAKNNLVKGDTMKIKPFRDFLLHDCGWRIRTKLTVVLSLVLQCIKSNLFFSRPKILALFYFA